MGGYDALSPREKYRLYRMEQTAVKLIAHMSEEMMHGLFRPEHFELELENGTPYPPLRDSQRKYGLVTVGGIIDLVWICIKTKTVDGLCARRRFIKP